MYHLLLVEPFALLAISTNLTTPAQYAEFSGFPPYFFPHCPGTSCKTVASFYPSRGGRVKCVTPILRSTPHCQWSTSSTRASVVLTILSLGLLMRRPSSQMVHCSIVDTNTFCCSSSGSTKCHSSSSCTGPALVSISLFRYSCRMQWNLSCRPCFYPVSDPALSSISSSNMILRINPLLNRLSTKCRACRR